MVIGRWCFIVLVHTAVDDSGHTPCDTKRITRARVRPLYILCNPMDLADPHAPFFVFNAFDTVLVEGLHRTFT